MGLRRETQSTLTIRSASARKRRAATEKPRSTQTARRDRLASMPTAPAKGRGVLPTRCLVGGRRAEKVVCARAEPSRSLSWEALRWPESARHLV